MPLVFLTFLLGMTFFVGDRLSHADPIQLRESVKTIPEKESSASAIATRALAMRYFNLGLELQKIGKWKAASLEYFRSVGEDDTLAEAHANLGLALAQQGEPEKAIPHHLRAIELKPTLPQAHVNLAIDLAHIGQYSEAWDHVHELQAMDHPVNPEFLKLLASRLPDPRKK